MHSKKLLLLLLIAGLGFVTDNPVLIAFVKTSKGKFYINAKQYNYVGANYWYGGLVGNTEAGKIRVSEELDFLLKQGVTNLRVLAGGEGEGTIINMKRVSPSLQPKAGIFDTKTLEGLDFLLSEMDKRKMKAVIYLSNNWEWSGGFYQYLNWGGLVSDSLLKSKWDWELISDNVSKFYSCSNCIQWYNQQVKAIVERTNSITGKKYINDPAIMAWELANEPRPMRTYAIPAYEKWVSSTAAYIKSMDHNHLITTGSEGEMGSLTMDVFKEMHADINIDYAVIHIWPKNWQWYSDTAIEPSWNKIVQNTNAYIRRHEEIAKQINKPLVIEEFGLPRDHQAYSITSATHFRDRYYSVICSALLKDISTDGILAGINFWAFSGSGRPSHLFWEEGDDVLGDPVQEEQGLNSVFDCDKSTWQIISSSTSKINHLTAKK